MSRRVSVCIEELVVRGLPRDHAAQTVAALRQELRRRARNLPDVGPSLEPSVRETVRGGANAGCLGARIADAVIRGSTR